MSPAPLDVLILRQLTRAPRTLQSLTARLGRSPLEVAVALDRLIRSNRARTRWLKGRRLIYRARAVPPDTRASAPPGIGPLTCAIAAHPLSAPARPLQVAPRFPPCLRRPNAVD